MEIIEKIKELKKKRNTVILVHNYQIPEVQDIADYLGDSLGLSIKASQTNADVIVFCGVYFMAETAKILSPEKKVLIPDKTAGCPMADMITAKQLRELKQKYPEAKVLCYVNTPAEVKAECDLCCTSANAVKMVREALKNEGEIIFVPDKYLGDYVSKQTKKNLILWDGYCPSHVKILAEDIEKQKKLHSQALVLVHPECTPEVIKLADEVLSTSGMCKFAKKSETKEFIIGTETGIIYRLKKENPDKNFYPATELAVCPNMKKINLEKILWTLEEMKYEILLSSDIISHAQISIQRMLNFID
jgi:quinolinate synthase